MQRRAFFRTTLVAGAAAALPRRSAFAAVFSEAPSRVQNLSAVTGDGRPVTLRASDVSDLRARLRGRVLLASDEGYDDARQILNPSFDKHPTLIVQPSGTADVRTAVNFARDNGGLLLAVKCGGHSASGQSTCDRGLMIDLSRFRDVRVDPVARTARVTGGSLLGAVDHEAMTYDLVTPMGTVSHTGVGGLVTGGGFGRVTRRFGLSVDNLLSVDVVTADGEFRHASADENPDLFWGVRGGGGNFGIVTSFEFRLHPMRRRIIGGTLMYPLARAREVLHVWADYGKQAPDDLALGLVIIQPPGGAPGFTAIEVCYIGPENATERVLAPIRKLGTPLTDQVAAMDYVALQRSGDMTDPRALGQYLKSGFIADVPAGLEDAIIEGFRGDPRRATQLFFQMSGGAISRVPSNATAFAQRDTFANMLAAVGWRHGIDDPAEHIAWVKQYWSSLERFTYGFYVNDLELDMTAAAIQANYRQNHDRLVAVKNKYDPKNLFRLNANVQPTV